MYMVQQRITTAVREGYAEADAAELERQLHGARAARTWLEGRAVESSVRASLLEPTEAVEEALAEASRRAARRP